MECRVKPTSLRLWKACAVSVETHMSGAEGGEGPKGSPPTRYGWLHPLPQGYAGAAPWAGIFRPVRPSPVWQEYWEKRKQIIGSGMIIVQRAEFFS